MELVTVWRGKQKKKKERKEKKEEEGNNTISYSATEREKDWGFIIDLVIIFKF